MVVLRFNHGAVKANRKPNFWSS